jgi:hypothetical protein
MADRGHRTTLCLPSGVIKADSVQGADLTAVIWLRPNVKPLQRHQGVRLGNIDDSQLVTTPQASSTNSWATPGGVGEVHI